MNNIQKRWITEGCIAIRFDLLHRTALFGKYSLTNKNCAFLRGMNVNGRTMKMVEVCDVFRVAGMTDVASVREA